MDGSIPSFCNPIRHLNINLTNQLLIVTANSKIIAKQQVDSNLVDYN